VTTTDAREAGRVSTPPQRSSALVLFGASGDLAFKMLWPAVYRLEETGELDGMPVIGVAASPWDDERLRDYARESLQNKDIGIDPAVWDALWPRISYVRGDYGDTATYRHLARQLGPRHDPLVYLAIPPALFDDVVDGLTRVGLNEAARLVVEKPFGRDRETAAQLNACILRSFPEERLFRIDHFLGKEAVENLLVFRFANAFVEPLWNRRYIDHVEITLAESFGVTERGPFYETVGALRDVVQNHLLSIVAFVAMEPPAVSSTAALRDEKVKVLRAIRSVDAHAVVRGQYDGYRDEPGVAPASDVETFVALELAVGGWRWDGVPFLVRTGKRMAASATEVVVEFKAAPRLLFTETGQRPHPTHLVFRLSGDEGATLNVEAKQPGDQLRTQTIGLDVSFHEALGSRHEPYHRLLADALAGDARRFARIDFVEEAWRIVDPVLRHPVPAVPYPVGSWGPPAAADLARRVGGWHQPRAVTVTRP
jgi:glucose-6-phosphate 1-dehydrogenase